MLGSLLRARGSEESRSSSSKHLKRSKGSSDQSGGCQSSGSSTRRHIGSAKAIKWIIGGKLRTPSFHVVSKVDKADMAAKARGKNSNSAKVRISTDPPDTLIIPNNSMLMSGPSASGSSHQAFHQQGLWVMDEDQGIMSEMDTASSSINAYRKSTKASKRVGVKAGPKTTLANRVLEKAASLAFGSHGDVADDIDAGVMSEAETASTTRGHKKRPGIVSATDLSLENSGKGGNGGRHSIPSDSLKWQRPSSGSGAQGGASTGLLPRLGLKSKRSEESDIMSEAETSSTSTRSRSTRMRSKLIDRNSLGMRRTSSSTTRSKTATLPVVRDRSKTLERPLGIVFLIYRGETKRALLPNEITSVDTVKALFVRSFNKALTMDYMELPRVRIYIHEGDDDVFVELEDLTEITDRTILKVFEVDHTGHGPAGLGNQGLPPITNSDELDAVTNNNAEPDYVDSQAVRNNKAKGSSSTLPRNAFSTEVASDESGGRGRRSESSKTSKASTSSDVRLMSRFSSGHQHYYLGPANPEEAKARMMHMEAQLSQLTGLVERALKHKKLNKKQVSFDKTVVFHDDAKTKHQASMSNTTTLMAKKSSGDNNNAMSVVHYRLKELHNCTCELREEAKVLRRLAQLQSMAMKDLVQDTYIRLREACHHVLQTPTRTPATTTSMSVAISSEPNESMEHLRVQVSGLLSNLGELEAAVEEVRASVVSKKRQITALQVDSLATSLSQCSRTTSALRHALPNERSHTTEAIEGAWRRCKKLTNTLVTLKRLASVQEQRQHTHGNNNVENVENVEVAAAKKKAAPEPPPRATPLAAAAARATPPRPPPRTSSHVTTSAMRADVDVTTTTTTTTTTSTTSTTTTPTIVTTRKANSMTGPPVAAKPDLIRSLSKSNDAVVGLDVRHQELLTRQRALQEQYERLQALQKKNLEPVKTNNGDVVNVSSQIIKEIADDALNKVANATLDKQTEQTDKA